MLKKLKENAAKKIPTLKKIKIDIEKQPPPTADAQTEKRKSDQWPEEHELLSAVSVAEVEVADAEGSREAADAEAENEVIDLKTADRSQLTETKPTKNANEKTDEDTDEEIDLFNFY